MPLEIDRYAGLDSPIHRWDPRWKIVAILGLAAAVLISDPLSPPALPMAGATQNGNVAYRWGSPMTFLWGCAPLALSIGMLLISRVPLRFALSRIKGAFWFLALILIVFPWRIEGASLRFEAESLYRAVQVVLRALALLVLTLVVFSTAPLSRTMAALRALRAPAVLVQSVFLSYRYLFVYSERLEQLRRSALARGYRSTASFQTLRTLGRLVGALLLGSAEQAGRLHSAMVLRGYRGRIEGYSELRSRPGDVMGCLVTWAAGALLILGRQG